MNKNSLFRKIAYIVGIVLLLGPLFALGRPSNGMIGQLRTKYKMGQANLGKLDPTSESMRLASLGMKGIAATILWLRADYYKEEKYFDRFSATLNQIALLQPHFISVWQHQAHNLAYNVAPEFEDYRQRYEWIKKGVDYLIRGTKYNDRKPILQYDLGHYLGNKLGKADEHVQYRSLYSKDSEFHKYLRDQGLSGIDTSALGYDQRPDNWLTGKLWFEQAVALYEAGASIKKSPHLLLCYGPLWQMYYAEAIESEGILDSSAQFAWKQAGTDWADFGTKSLYQYRQSRDLTLLSNKLAYTEVESLEKRFDEISVGAKEKAVEVLRKGFPASMLQILDKPADERTPEEVAVFDKISSRVVPNSQQIAAQLPTNLRLEGVELGRKIAFLKDFIRETESYRGQVNYSYWETRAKAEQREDMVEARRFMFDADQLINLADVLGALESYEKAWVRWAQVFARYPTMINEEVGDDVIKSLDRYKRLVDEELDENFVLNDILIFRHWYQEGTQGTDVSNLEAKIDSMIARASALLEAESRGEETPVIDPVPPTKESSPIIPATNISPSPKTASPSPETASPSPETTSPSPETSGVKAEPPKEVAAGNEVLSKRPPTLENPDSQK